MGPLLKAFGRRKAASQLAEDEGISMFKAMRCIRNAEDATPEELAMASGKPAESFKDGLYVAAAVAAGYAGEAVVVGGPAVGALFDGKIIEWLMDPANQEKLFAFIQFIMKIAVLFI